MNILFREASKIVQNLLVLHAGGKVIAERRHLAAPRGRELPASLKAINKMISRVRATVEHAISGLKRCRIVVDAFRNWRQGMVDEVMLAASGLHNLRVIARA